MKSMNSAAPTKFDAALSALQQAMRGDLAFEETLAWDAKFQQFYKEHVQDVIASSPAFAPLATNLEARIGTLISWADRGGVTLAEVKALMGVEPLVFKAFLSRLRINDTDALIYLGGGHLVSFDFANIAKQEVH